MLFVVRIRTTLVVSLALLAPAIASALSSPGDGAELTLAYLDPGAGSFAVQALVAMIAGIAVTGRVYWSKIKSLLGMATTTADDDDDAIDDE